MKIVPLKLEEAANKRLTNQRQADQAEEDIASEADVFEYQGKRRDQVEGSYKIFALSILALLIVTILYLVSHG